MKKVLYITYIFLVFFSLLLLGYQGITFQNQVYQSRPNEKFEQLTNYTNYEETDISSPIGEFLVFEIELKNLPSEHTALVFFTFHQGVRIWIEEECSYSLLPSKTNAFGKSTGYVWHSFPLRQEDVGKNIRVELIPSYEESLHVIPDFYLGSSNKIFKYKFHQSIPSLFIGAITVLIGLFFIFLGFYNLRNPYWNNLLMLGLVALYIGLWKLTDTPVTSLIISDTIVTSTLPFISLLLVVIPFVLFMKSLQKEDNKLWIIVCIVSVIQSILILFLQITDIADFRETIFLTHGTMILTAFLVIYMVTQRIRKTGWIFKTKLNAIGMSICLLGMITDLVCFYLLYGNYVMLIGISFFVIYITVVGVMLIMEANQLAKMGANAKKYENMAYRDQLTGLFNRTAYAAFLEQPDFSPNNYIVVMFDLNNLKKCNDTLGHSAGDRYITDSANLIKQNFGGLGKCYRIGGDEFCVLIKHHSLEKCQERHLHLQEDIAKYNQNSPDILMGIACGWVKHDSDLDYDLRDTLRRADKMMYQQKLKMKQ